MKGRSKGFGWKRSDKAVVRGSKRKVKVLESKKDDFYIVQDEKGSVYTVYGALLEKEDKG